MRDQTLRIRFCLVLLFGCACIYVGVTPPKAHGENGLDQELRAVLAGQGFTGRIEATVEARLGRALNQKLAGAGNLLYYDAILGIKQDNACAACHSPTTGYADTQSIAVGIDSNGWVSQRRSGPRNRRRTPTSLNAAFYPSAMWNARFASLSGDPFDNRMGFQMPEPEGRGLSYFSHLLAAQACMPVTDRAEMVGFTFSGDNAAIRATLAQRVDGVKRYRKMFGKVYPEVAASAPITFDMIANAIAEYELTLVYADAPIDRYARGDAAAMSDNEKRGALLFFGKARCVECHAVSGQSNEMFSDFLPHVVAVPQLVPETTNAGFDGPGADEDYGREQVTHDPADRYKFRTSPLRNLGAQPAFFHDGAFLTIRSAILHHLNPYESARRYDPRAEGVARDLRRIGPVEPMLARLDPILATPIELTPDEVQQLTAFVRDSLLDERARFEILVKQKPAAVPSGLKPFFYEYP